MGKKADKYFPKEYSPNSPEYTLFVRGFTQARFLAEEEMYDLEKATKISRDALLQAYLDSRKLLRSLRKQLKDERCLKRNKSQ